MSNICPISFQDLSDREWPFIFSIPSFHRNQVHHHYFDTLALYRWVISKPNGPTNPNTGQLIDKATLDRFREAVNKLLTNEDTQLAVLRQEAENEGYPLVHYVYKTLPDRLPSILTPENVNQPNDKGYTLMHTAAVEGDETVIRVLCEHGADVNCRISPEEFTALFGAIGQGHLSIVRLLIQQGADVMHKYDGSYTPLLVVTNRHAMSRDTRVRCCCTEIAQLLIDNGADAKQAWSVISCSIEEYDEMLIGKVARAVLACSERELLTNERELLTNAAIYLDDINLFERYTSKNDYPKFLEPAIYFNRERVVQKLLDEGVNPDGERLQAIPPIHLAVYQCNYRIVSLLISKGARVNRRDRINHRTTISRLGQSLSKGPARAGQVPARAGQVPARAGQVHDTVEIIRALLNAGLTVYKKDMDYFPAGSVEHNLISEAYKRREARLRQNFMKRMERK